MQSIVSIENTYGLIGKSLAHSFSKNYFTDKFSRMGLGQSSYHLYELPAIAGFPALLQRIDNLAGLNVTIPYKRAIIPYLTELTPLALQIGAVNCIRMTPDGSLIGHNTDSIGFENDLLTWLSGLGRSIPQNTLILGAGGASASIEFALRKLGSSPTIVSRNPEDNQLSYQEIKPRLHQFDLIVNTTPLGTLGLETLAPPFEYNGINIDALAYDLVYNPPVTEFMRLCAQQGAQVRNGYGMLVGQAEAAWEFWGNNSVN
jgi:shikimate dehydrogenase